jgi:protein TonB
MEKIKNENVDIEKKRGSYLTVGLMAAMSLMLAAFVWTTYDVRELVSEKLELDLTEEEIIPQNIVTPPPPPPPPQQTTVIEIVDDEEEIEEELDLEDMELDEDTEIETFEEEEEEVEEDEIFMVVEKMPTLPACKNISDPQERDMCTQKEIITLVQSNAKYPPIAKDAGIQGTVYVYFEVSKEGKVENIQVRRGVDKRLDDEAVRAVKSLPLFEPGKQQGRNVRVQYTIPVKFTIK